jgi:LPXTG-site transpeptidase (sortase) family protein
MDVRMNVSHKSRQSLLAFVCFVVLVLGGVQPAQAAVPLVEAGAATEALLQPAIPTRILIPALGIDASIETVGQDENGLMAAPSRVETVAWYSVGSQPGESGNAVMAGHLDDYRGRPAVFWELDKLQPGDEVIVRFRDGDEVYFEVMSVEEYDADAAPMERIFGVDFERDLNLITCAGAWDAQNKLYEHRVVVYTRLIREPASTTADGQSSAVESTIAENFAANVQIAETEAIRATGSALVPAVNVPVPVEEPNDSPEAATSSKRSTSPTTRPIHSWKNSGQPATTH